MQRTNFLAVYKDKNNVHTTLNVRASNKKSAISKVLKIEQIEEDSILSIIKLKPAKELIKSLIPNLELARDFYLQWANDYISLERFCLDKNLTESEAVLLIDIGRAYQDTGK